MHDNLLKVLLVEDNKPDARLLEKLLAKAERNKYELRQIELLQEAIACLQADNFDVVLLDLGLPDSQGLETVRQMHAAVPQVPIVVLTGWDDQEIAVQALREGAQDYLVKGEIQPLWLVRAINYAIEREKMLEKLENLNSELARSNQELEQFAYIVSHDLQQPLMSISGFAKLFVKTYEDRLDAQALHFIDRIVTGANRMQELIKDLLSYSRLGKKEFVLDATDCNQVVAQVLSNLQGAIASSGAIVAYENMPTVMANEWQIAQLFQNLIANAIKYSRPDLAPRVNVSVEMKQELNEWQFGIHDNGIGIKPEHFERIFDIFQRLHNAEEYSGTGIGLAICKKIVESHKGRIWVESELGVGTSFYFTIPEPDM
ncbi:MAG: ATP-binding protein [Hormoscilla sp.]